jgi:hypothetical protein
VLPAAVVIIVIGIGGMQVAGEQIRLQGGVADAARLLGRGDGGAAERVATVASGATLSDYRDGDLVCAVGAAPAGFGGIRMLTLRATACTLDDSS